jgi:hypothetical protein
MDDVGDSLLYVNGVNAHTGEYVLPPLTPELVTQVASGHPLDPAQLSALRQTYTPEEEQTLGPTFGVDPNSLASAGWGIVFTQSAPADELREALAPLLELRKAQAGALYREFSGPDGYFSGETSLDYVGRFGSGPGPVRPAVMPYYLMLVGEPEDIPFEFQYQLDVMHAVGRICFDTLDEYRAYANAVVNAETSIEAADRSLGFFAPRNTNDVPTRRSSEYLVRPLSQDLRANYASWQITERIGSEARKQALAEMLGGPQTPSIIFTASHGIVFPSGDPRQRAYQGSLLCQEWPGPGSNREISSAEFFSGDDIGGGANVSGRIAFFFACYGNGTPKTDDFAQAAGAAPIAPTAFVARLPQRLLSRGALAVIGHVDRAWGWSFSWPRAGNQIETFRAALECLMAGSPVGLALEYFNERYALISSELTEQLQKNKNGMLNQTTIAGLWTANNDARNYTVFGDPAARLKF